MLNQSRKVKYKSILTNGIEGINSKYFYTLKSYKNHNKGCFLYAEYNKKQRNTNIYLVQQLIDT